MRTNKFGMVTSAKNWPDFVQVIDQTFAFRQIFEMLRRYISLLRIVIFLDLKATFESFDWTALFSAYRWKCMEDSQPVASIRVYSKLLEVLYSCPISPFLFNGPGNRRCFGVFPGCMCRTGEEKLCYLTLCACSNPRTMPSLH